MNFGGRVIEWSAKDIAESPQRLKFLMNARRVCQIPKCWMLFREIALSG